jgi:hypothetical protein
MGEKEVATDDRVGHAPARRVEVDESSGDYVAVGEGDSTGVHVERAYR